MITGLQHAGRRYTNARPNIVRSFVPKYMYCANTRRYMTLNSISPKQHYKRVWLNIWICNHIQPLGKILKFVTYYTSDRVNYTRRIKSLQDILMSELALYTVHVCAYSSAVSVQLFMANMSSAFTWSFRNTACINIVLKNKQL